MSGIRILLIHTGGTIGMIRGKSGFAPAAGVVEGEIERLRATSHRGLSVDIIRLDPLIDSANATPGDWNRITDTIVAGYAKHDAFLITHGTDTLAFCAAALTFALEGLGKPVILTGSMLPLTEPDNDGRRNLSDALTAVATAPAGVRVQFAGRLLHGARIRKTHSHFFDAFAAEPASAPPLRPGKTLLRHVYQSWDVGVLPVVPGGAGNVMQFAAGSCDGIVLRCFGSGTVPNTVAMGAALNTAMRRSIPVVAVSQCPEGGMALGTYAAGAILTRHAVIDGRDMTMEAAYVKTILALSQCSDIDAQRKFLAAPLCGELTLSAPS